MGMSGDYQLAIECGSTSVRIGSSIFEQEIIVFKLFIRGESSFTIHPLPY